MTALVQTASVTWASGSQGSAKTITFPAPVTPGNLVIIKVSYSHDIINSVSGLGATWGEIQSREGSNNNYPSAEIWYAAAVTAGSTLTVTPNPSFGIDGGSAIAEEWSGVTATVKANSVQSTQTGLAVRSTAALAATAGDLYVGVITQTVGPGPTSVTYSPGAFNTTDSHSNSNSWTVSGSRVAAGAETPSITTNWSGAGSGLQVAAVFGAASTTIGRLSRLSTETLVDPVSPAPRLSRASVETLVDPVSPSSLLSRASVETLVDPVAPAPQLSRVSVEVLIRQAAVIGSVQEGWGVVMDDGTPAADTITTTPKQSGFAAFYNNTGYGFTPSSNGTAALYENTQ